MVDERSPTLSVKTLSAAVAKAVQREQDKQALSDEFVINHIIMGIVMVDEIPLSQAQAIAGRISEEVGKSPASPGGEAALATSSHLEPAVLATQGRVICGFLPDRNILFGE